MLSLYFYLDPLQLPWNAASHDIEFVGINAHPQSCVKRPQPRNHHAIPPLLPPCCLGAHEYLLRHQVHAV
ncbi:hypothetical protein BC938DRAFT_473211 [Jimgerdemannia flammicorona]|uniref:Uncharacterized protein n=1 Tax=Jimgerdemannia flammicorona TaxID=994334 RepID=A0A433Q4Q5_9FUNG|nr:hypothetical protein BC938DRAFT_473211 [Jimgerdemannia flammicorona]